MNDHKSCKIRSIYKIPFRKSNHMYFDFSNAFDSLPHVRLLNNLRHKYGVYGQLQLLKWFRSFLVGRRQCVVATLSP